jgi:hypothetical protein
LLWVKGRRESRLCLATVSENRAPSDGERGIAPRRHRDGTPCQVWIDLPAANRDKLVEVCRRLKLPEETVSSWLLRCNGPRVVLRPDSVFIVCHVALAREHDLFFSYQVRMLIRSDLIITTHGSSGRKPEPLQRLLPGLEAAVEAGPQHLASAFLREVAASYGRVLDGVLDRASPGLNRPGVPYADPLRQRLSVFARRLREQKSLLMMLRGRGSRFFKGGYALVDELTAVLVSVEIAAAAVAHLCGHERRAR